MFQVIDSICFISRRVTGSLSCSYTYRQVAVLMNFADKGKFREISLPCIPKRMQLIGVSLLSLQFVLNPSLLRGRNLNHYTFSIFPNNYIVENLVSLLFLVFIYEEPCKKI